jgi:thioredoxin reductase
MAAFLRASNVEFRIFGDPMSTWRDSMPPGMLLKSHPWSSCLYDPNSEYTLMQFCKERGIDYHDSLWALPVETFVDYGTAFQARFVPNVEKKRLVQLETSPQGFRATFNDGDCVQARSVIIAVGVHPFTFVPRTLDHLPGELVSHSSSYGNLEPLQGKEVTVVGGGASASDLAGLLHENGSAVSLIARRMELRFHTARGGPKSRIRQLAQPLKPLLVPSSGIGTGWLLKICADMPEIFHALPQSTRLDIVRKQLGPSGHSQMRDRVIGKVRLYMQRKVELAEAVNGKVKLHCTSNDGEEKETVTADHVVAATGYRIDLTRLGFLDDRLLSRIETEAGAPTLSSNYESSVPGLHFVGAASANSFGPVARFVFGAIHPARRVSKYLSSKREGRVTVMRHSTGSQSTVPR